MATVASGSICALLAGTHPDLAQVNMAAMAARPKYGRPEAGMTAQSISICATFR
jgi:hypothetical protein